MNGNRREPGGRSLAVRLLSGLLVAQFVLFFPVLMHLEGLGAWGWAQLAGAAAAAVAADLLLLAAVTASSIDRRLAHALSALATLVGAGAVALLATAAYLP